MLVFVIQVIAVLIIQQKKENIEYHKINRYPFVLNVQLRWLVRDFELKK
jgi:hypothetical protein